MDKRLKVSMVLESIVRLRDDTLYGYKVLSRVYTREGEEIHFLELSKDVRAKVENTVLEYALKNLKDINIFINLPVELSIDSVLLKKADLFVCINADMSIQDLAFYVQKIKTAGGRICIDDFYVPTMDFSQMLLGSFEVVALKEDFYSKLNHKDLKRLVSYIKQFGSLVCFKKIDSLKKLQLAIDVGADLGHGYIFGYEEHIVGIIE
ncbi:EAL domain-containing protein [Thermocrinis minervae]|uniref:EAL domain, c-di-GMP-specific phosphodiesterase class I (Or its enzymatically inactive variant) n=1 Tax=Thermocrinis minervae TaxID=381751 RepID=A0A1M6S5F9_9AQUI|nr:EAL domain-containing protein [Thermocrinis minervae]SHK40054.1 EAL domain, c-di-GMP-specific phosphodiesterase class I (or its enzymatically inactive variant) [Thermocrinis minervae]